MRFVSMNAVKEGMILAKPLFGKNDEFLLGKGAVLLQSYITKIESLGYNGLYIDDELSKEISIPEIIDDNLRYEAVKSVKSTFLSIENGTNVALKACSKFSEIVSGIVDSIMENPDALVNIMDLKLFDDYTFFHSVNVCILAVSIGTAYNLNRNSLCNLGLSAILHDIGKTFIPKEILNKNSSLTSQEYDVVKTHSIRGYTYIKDNFDLPSPSYVGILHHHEKHDGSGYPTGASGEKISLFGKIVSICDVYDAITSSRPYRRALPPSEAIEYIMGNSGTSFDPELVKVFTRKIAPYPVGTCVRLSNNKIGLVVENYPDFCTRPKVKIFQHGKTAVDPYYIDLKNDMDTLGIIITGVV